MSTNEIQNWMLFAFIIALLFSFYKIYLMFNKPGEGIDTHVEKDELTEIVKSALHGITASQYNAEAIYKKIISEDFDEKRYKNFNLNRFNQTVNSLFVIYKVDTIEQLLPKL